MYSWACRYIENIEFVNLGVWKYQNISFKQDKWIVVGTKTFLVLSL